MFLNHISITSLLCFAVFACFSLKERSAQPTISPLQADYQTAGPRQTLNSSGGHSECSPTDVVQFECPVRQSAEGLWIKDHLVTAELRDLVRCIRRALGVFVRAVPCCTAHAG